jgi:hypothetical protein
VGVALPDSSGMACVYAGGGGTPGAVKFEFDIIRELRVWTIRIWTDNLRPKTRISKRDYIFAKGKKTHTKSRDSIAQTSIAPRDLPQYLISFEVSFQERAFGLLLKELYHPCKKHASVTLDGNIYAAKK